MKMKLECTRALMVLCVALAGSAMAAQKLPPPAPLTKQGYDAEKAKIEAQYQADDKYCDGVKVKENLRKVCHAEAKGRADALKAELDARLHPSPEANQKAKNITAEANFNVAKAKCEPLKDAAKDRCMKEAKAAREAAVRQAKVEKVQETGGAFRNSAATANKHLKVAGGAS